MTLLPHRAASVRTSLHGGRVFIFSILLFVASGCIVPGKISAARDADGRLIGADIGAAKGLTTTQLVTGDGATGQVGGVNTALTYMSGGLGISLAAVVMFVIGSRMIGEISDNHLARYEADLRAKTQSECIAALKEVMLAFAKAGQ